MAFTATVDIGIKNLALCVMGRNEETCQIYFKLWEVFNVVEDESDRLCCELMKNKMVCGNMVSYKHKNAEGDIVYTCKKHFPKDVPMKNDNLIKIKKVKDFSLQEIASKVITQMTKLFANYGELFSNVGKVLIELQPKVNNKMKFVSHIVYSKFVEHYMTSVPVPIRFVRASQKLKAYKGPEVQCKLKTPYAKRKYLSVEYTKWMLDNLNVEDVAAWKTIFSKHKKQDDLSDVFLMCINDFNSNTKVKVKKGKVLNCQ
jgi:hypothetical protein